MRLVCNTPPNLWEEFCATAAYLTNLTASTSIDRRTPYELWFQHVPSLSHLREIGCRAFALIPTNNPKILQHTVPCVLIGYAPCAKAYRLWDCSTGKIFNSFHVAFIEHLEELPSKLLPGKSSNHKKIPLNGTTMNPMIPHTMKILPYPTPPSTPPPQLPSSFPPDTPIASKNTPHLNTTT